MSRLPALTAVGVDRVHVKTGEIAVRETINPRAMSTDLPSVVFARLATKRFVAFSAVCLQDEGPVGRIGGIRSKRIADNVFTSQLVAEVRGNRDAWVGVVMERVISTS